VRVAGIRAGHDFEERAHVGDRASQGTNDPDPTKSAGARREVAGCGNAAGRGLQSTDAAKMGGETNGAAAVTADAAHRATCSDGCGFAWSRLRSMRDSTDCWFSRRGDCWFHRPSGIRACWCYLNFKVKVLTTSVFRFQELAIDSLKDGLLFLTEGNHAGDLETVLSVS